MVNTKVLFKMTLREIKSNFKQYIALILISFLAVTLFIGLTSNSKALQARVDDLYNQSNIADVFVYVDSTKDEEKGKLLNLEGVESIEERLNCTGYADSRAATFFIAPEDNKMNQYYSLDEGGSRGFLIDEHYKELSQKKVGDNIIFSLPISLRVFRDQFMYDYIENDPLGSLFNYDLLLSTINGCLKEGARDPFDTDEMNLETPLTGIMKHPEAAEVSSGTSLRVMMDSELLQTTIVDTLTKRVNDSFDDSKPWTPMIKENMLKAIENINVTNFFNQYLIKVKEGTDLTALNKKINEYFSSDEESSKLVSSLTVENLPTTVTLETDVHQAEQLTLVFPAIFFIVAILVVLTSLSQLIYRSRSDIGTMKAIGIPKLRILSHYVWFGMILCFIGCLLGSIVGPLLIPNIMNRKYDILYNLPAGHIVFPWGHIIFCTLLFCLLSGFVSFLVSRGEVNLSPVESMRPKQMKALKARKKEDKKKKTPFMLSMRMAYRNITTNWTRTFMVIIGVMGCTALLVSGFGIMDTVNYGIDLDFNSHMASDINLTYGTSGKEKEEITKLEGIQYYEPYMALPIQATFNDNAVDGTITLYENSNSHSYDFNDMIQDGIVLSYHTAERLNVTIGDTLNIVYLGNSYALKVDGLFESSYLLQFYTKKDNLKDIEYSPSGADIILKEGYNQQEVKQKIEDLGLNISSIATADELTSRIHEILGSIEIMCNTVKVFAILLAIVVTYNLALLNFNDRKRDIATLKVIGCRRWEIMCSFIGEIMFLTIIGVIFGLFLGYPLLVTILSVNQTSLFYFLYHIFFETYLFSILIALGSSLIVNLLLGRLAAKVDAVMALKSVE